jgi:hypothetical protein
MDDGGGSAETMSHDFEKMWHTSKSYSILLQEELRQDIKFLSGDLDSSARFYRAAQLLHVKLTNPHQSDETGTFCVHNRPLKFIEHA